MSSERPLLAKVKSKMFLHARRRVLHLLDGQYASHLRGRSMDFDDLREYVAGDEIKDIDWKASARTGQPLVKRYVAERRHRVLFAVDGGRNMAAISASGEPKREVLVTALGVLGYLAIRHGDEVGLVTGSSEGIRQLPFRSTSSALERMLHAVYDSVGLETATSDMNAVLDRVRLTVRHRALLVVIADEFDWDEERAALVRRLAAQHEIVWLQITDAEPHQRGARGELAFDVEGNWAMPSLFGGDRLLEREFEYAEQKRALDMERTFEANAVSYAEIASEQQVAPTLLALLKARMNVRR
ncbi:uncharacterized protein (DUF58 family) [Pseudoclavibacter sp. JAI123]|uniref:DUF58 domain-containing protein n=1 Tax=Pseudoclavibacter sp. JAI123 TaxID=2723065 RepID=UPI0015C7B0B0|nr:DUF58 domain-containing protein [Pseudoclavibacter sp. JAI123]NYF13399.1 uncharacterized protein (DUF58 family) [Pseudoclavibacter sp. JAI123]